MDTDAPRVAFWSNRPVALTGATGFVGHHVATQLARLGARVAALVRPTTSPARLVAAGVEVVRGDLEDRAAVDRLCRGRDMVLHLAAAVSLQGDWERIQRINVGGAQRVVTAARAAGVRRLVHTSSIVAVGASRTPQALDETAVWDLARYRVPYVTTKREAEDRVRAEAGRDLEIIITNPASIVGPDDFAASEFGTLCKRFWRGRVPFYFGGGNNFVDVRDVAVGHLLAAERGRPGERYLLTGSNCTYAAFFADLARVAGRPIFRLRLPQVLGSGIAALNELLPLPHGARPYLALGHARLMPLYFYFDCGKARRELGYEPRPLAQTLRDAHVFWMERKSA